MSQPKDGVEDRVQRYALRLAVILAMFGVAITVAALRFDSYERCVSLNRTRHGLVAFFESAARARLTIERQETDPHAAKLDAQIIAIDQLAAGQEMPQDCGGIIP